MSITPSEATARVLAYSVHETYTTGLVTVEATFARSALAELNTHRVFSRNSASSRAIPVKKMLEQVENHPFVPRRFSLAQKGMATDEFVTPEDGAWDDCLDWWIDSRDAAVDQAEKGLELGLHKQDVNRILEPFLMHTAIISSVEWQNFVDLRLAVNDQGNPLAYPPIFDLALAIATAIDEFDDPEVMSPDVPWEDEASWHLPLTGPEDEGLDLVDLIKISAARCARVSYLTHDGKRDHKVDLELFDRLHSPGHWSPFEHPAHPVLGEGSGNFRHGHFRQLRYYVEQGLF